MRVTILPAVLFGALLSAQLVSSRAGGGSIPASSQLYQRVTNTFVQAVLFKPTEPDHADFTFTMAPLMFQEVEGAASRCSADDRFGELLRSGNRFSIKVARPVVYFKSDVVRIHGQDHARVSYVWFYSGSHQRSRGQSVSVQGVRIILDSSGKPAVWEVLSDPSAMVPVYVSKTLEAAAAAEFGPPLPSRHYAIEASVQDVPAVAVPRVIEDGPVAMGPIIYLQSGTRAVCAVICRCMPAQAAQLTGTFTYDLMPWEGSFASQASDFVEDVDGPKFSERLRFRSDGQVLEKLLRLPASF